MEYFHFLWHFVCLDYLSQLSQAILDNYHWLLTAIISLFWTAISSFSNASINLYSRFLLLWFFVFPTVQTMSAVGKEPHFFFRGPLLDWLGQIMFYSHWLTQTWCSTHAHIPATDEDVLFTLITLELAMRHVVAVDNPNSMSSCRSGWIKFSLWFSVLVTLPWSWSTCCCMLVRTSQEATAASADDLMFLLLLSQAKVKSTPSPRPKTGVRQKQQLQCKFKFSWVGNYVSKYLYLNITFHCL